MSKKVFNIKDRAIHLYLDEQSLEIAESKGVPIIYTFDEVDLLRRNTTALEIHTTQTSLLRWSFAGKLFVHLRDEVHELKIGDCEGTEREIREGHNMEKLLISGEFSWYRD